MKTAALMLFAAAFVAAAPASGAESKSKLPAPMRSIEPVNVEVQTVVVTGTVTVRSRGLRVSPADVTYSFQPEFKFSTGYLFPVEDGVYVFHADNVPRDRSHVLTIRSAHNDTEIRNGLVHHLGQTTTGTLRIDIPLGRDFSFGEQILDLR